MNLIKTYQKFKVRVQLVRDCLKIPKYKVGSADDIYYLLKDEIEIWDREKLLSIMLNSINHVIAIDEIAVGSLDTIVINVREVFKSAILANANRIILAHNHLSDNLNPSEQDQQSYQALKAAGDILGIELLDHLVISNHGYMSFADQQVTIIENPD